jgi:hypothetical protein
VLGGEARQGQGLELAQVGEFGVLAGDALGEFGVAGLQAAFTVSWQPALTFLLKCASSAARSFGRWR